MKTELVKIATIEDMGDSYKVHKHTEDTVMLHIINKVENVLRVHLNGEDPLRHLNVLTTGALVLKDGKKLNVYFSIERDLYRYLALFTTDKSFKRNLEPGGILELQQNIAIEMLINENRPNLVLIPIRLIQDGDESYWEYKIHYAGEQLELNRKINGVSVPDNYFSRHNVSIYGDFTSLTDLMAAERYVSFIEELVKVPKHFKDFYDKAYRWSNSGYTENMDESERKATTSASTYTVVKISNVRGLVQGKVRSCLVFACPYTRGAFNNIIEDMVEFKSLLKQPKNQVPNPALDMDIFNNRLVRNTLLAILRRSCLIIPTKRFYVQLKHLGLIKDYYRLNSIENIIHVWKLFNSLEPKVTEHEALLSIRYSRDNFDAYSMAAVINSTLRCTSVDEGSTVTMEIIGDKEIIDHYRDLAVVKNIEII